MNNSTDTDYNYQAEKKTGCRCKSVLLLTPLSLNVTAKCLLLPKRITIFSEMCCAVGGCVENTLSPLCLLSSGHRPFQFK